MSMASAVGRIWICERTYVAGALEPMCVRAFLEASLTGTRK